MREAPLARLRSRRHRCRLAPRRTVARRLGGSGTWQHVLQSSFARAGRLRTDHPALGGAPAVLGRGAVALSEVEVWSKAKTHAAAVAGLNFTRHSLDPDPHPTHGEAVAVSRRSSLSEQRGRLTMLVNRPLQIPRNP